MDRPIMDRFEVIKTHGSQIIEQIKLQKGEDKSIIVDSQGAILMLMQGEVDFETDNQHAWWLKENEIVFLSPYLTYTLSAISNSQMLLFNLSTIENWQSCLSERVFQRHSSISPKGLRGTCGTRLVPYSEHIRMFAARVQYYLEHGMVSAQLLKIKACELLLLLKCFCTDEELKSFFYGAR